MKQFDLNVTKMFDVIVIENFEKEIEKGIKGEPNCLLMVLFHDIGILMQKLLMVDVE
jgi:hypothetical protein